MIREALLRIFDLAEDRPDIREVALAALASSPGVAEEGLREATTALLGEVGFMRSCIASGEKLNPSDLVRQNAAMANATKLLSRAALTASDPVGRPKVSDPAIATGATVPGGYDEAEDDFGNYYLVRKKRGASDPVGLDVPVAAEKAFIEAVNARSATGEGVAVPHIRDIDRIWDAIKPYLAASNERAEG
jgi:hypothetical protein